MCMQKFLKSHVKGLVSKPANQYHLQDIHKDVIT